MYNDLYDKLARIDDIRKNRVTLQPAITKMVRLRYDYQNDFDYSPISLYTTKINSSEIIEEKQKIKRK